MPTYEYRCPKCQHAFEAFQRMTEAPLRTCPKCRGRVKRLIGRGAGIIFKGSGFYETDYRRQGSKGAAVKESAASTASTASSDKPAGGDKPASSDLPKTAASAPKKASCEAAK